MTAAFAQGWYDARDVHFAGAGGDRVRQRFNPQRAAAVYADPAETPRHVLDYIAGAWAWLGRFTLQNEERPGCPGLASAMCPSGSMKGRYDGSTKQW